MGRSWRQKGEQSPITEQFSLLKRLKDVKSQRLKFSLKVSKTQSLREKQCPKQSGLHTLKQQHTVHFTSHCAVHSTSHCSVHRPVLAQQGAKATLEQQLNPLHSLLLHDVHIFTSARNFLYFQTTQTSTLDKVLLHNSQIVPLVVLNQMTKG